MSLLAELLAQGEEIQGASIVSSSRAAYESAMRVYAAVMGGRHQGASLWRRWSGFWCLNCGKEGLQSLVQPKWILASPRDSELDRASGLCRKQATQLRTQIYWGSRALVWSGSAGISARYGILSSFSTFRWTAFWCRRTDRTRPSRFDLHWRNAFETGVEKTGYGVAPFGYDRPTRISIYWRSFSNFRTSTSTESIKSICAKQWDAYDAVHERSMT